MKKITGISAFIFLMIITVIRPGFSQTIWTEPDLPAADQEITIYFDATGTGVEGYKEHCMPIQA